MRVFTMMMPYAGFPARGRMSCLCECVTDLLGECGNQWRPADLTSPPPSSRGHEIQRPEEDVEVAAEEPQHLVSIVLDLGLAGTPHLPFSPVQQILEDPQRASS